MKRFIITVYLLIVTASCLYAEEIRNKAEQNIYDLEYAALKVEAIDNDIYFCYGWKPEKKKNWKKSPGKA